MNRRLWSASATVLFGLWLLDFIAWPFRARGVGALTIAAIKLALFAWLGTVAFRAGYRRAAAFLPLLPALVALVGFTFAGIVTDAFVQHHFGPAALLADLCVSVVGAVAFGGLGALLAHQQRKRSGVGPQAI